MVSFGDPVYIIKGNPEGENGYKPEKFSEIL